MCLIRWWWNPPPCDFSFTFPVTLTDRDLVRRYSINKSKTHSTSIGFWNWRRDITISKYCSTKPWNLPQNIKQQQNTCSLGLALQKNCWTISWREQEHYDGSRSFKTCGSCRWTLGARTTVGKRDCTNFKYEKQPRRTIPSACNSQSYLK